MIFPESVKYQKAVMKIIPSLQLHIRYSSKINEISDNLLFVPTPKTEIFRNSFSSSGSMIWNVIPEDVKQSSSVAMVEI